KEASRLRLRPIVMTSFAFIFGVFPLMVANGPGAEMRRSLGVAVFSGMLGVTIFGIFLTPVFFYVVQALGEALMLRSSLFRWTLAYTAGTALGAASGFLLARIGLVAMPWGPLVGGCAGFLLIRGLRGLKARIGTRRELARTAKRHSAPSIPNGE